MTMAWDPVTSGSNNWWYVVGGTGGAFRVDPPNTTFIHPGLWPNTTYTHYVYVVDTNSNRSGDSNSVSYTTPPDTTPPSGGCPRTCRSEVAVPRLRPAEW
jgi:hypothetical protein